MTNKYNKILLCAHNLLRVGGSWLGAARKWMQWHRCCGNGQTIIWGSHEEVKPPLMMREVEEIAAEAVAEALNDFANKYADALLALANIPLEKLGSTGGYATLADQPDNMNIGRWNTHYITIGDVRRARRALEELGFKEN